MEKVIVEHKSVRKASRHRRRFHETRQKLIYAARSLFSEKGFDLTTIDEITARADLGKGTFYYYFRTKSGLIREMIKELLDQLEEVLVERCRGLSDLDALLEEILQAHLDFFGRRREDFVLYFQCRADLVLQEGYAGIEMPFNKYLARIEALLDEVAHYNLPAVMLRRITCALAGFISGYYSFALVKSHDENIEETFVPLRSALVASLARYIRESGPMQPSESA